MWKGTHFASNLYSAPVLCWLCLSQNRKFREYSGCIFQACDRMNNGTTLRTVVLSTRIGLIFATKAVIRGNVHKKQPEIRWVFQTSRYLKGFGLFWRHYEVTNGWNYQKKIREAYLYEKIFEITIIQLTMAEIKQFSIILAFTALWDIKIKEMAAISKSHRICSKIQISC